MKLCSKIKFSLLFIQIKYHKLIITSLKLWSAFISYHREECCSVANE